MKDKKKIKIMAASLAVLFTVCFVWLLITMQSNSSLNKDLDKEKLTSDALLSEKLLTEKALKKNIARVNSLESDKTKLNDQLTQRNKLVSTQALENRTIRMDLDYFKSHYKGEVDRKNELEKKLTASADAFATSELARKTLADSLQFFLNENQYLKNELEKSILKSIDQTMVTGLKKNDQSVTSKAKAVRKLVAHVEVPAKLQNMHFTVQDSDGVLLSDDSAITSRVLSDDSKSATASLEDIPTASVQSKAIEIIYTPKEKLKSGIYIIQIFNDMNYVGSLQVKLR